MWPQIINTPRLSRFDSKGVNIFFFQYQHFRCIFKIIRVHAVNTWWTVSKRIQTDYKIIIIIIISKEIKTIKKKCIIGLKRELLNSGRSSEAPASGQDAGSRLHLYWCLNRTEPCDSGTRKSRTELILDFPPLPRGLSYTKWAICFRQVEFEKVAVPSGTEYKPEPAAKPRTQAEQRVRLVKTHT